MKFFTPKYRPHLLSVASILFLFLVLTPTTTSAHPQSLRVSDKRMQQLESFVKNNHIKTNNGATELDFTDLDIADEREAGLLCNFFTRSVQGFLEENVPFQFDCSCRIQFFRRKIKYSCDTSFCIDDFKEILPVSVDTPLPLADTTCVSPSVGGTSNFRGNANSQVCTGETDVTVDVVLIEESTGVEISDNDEETFTIPDTCLSVSHDVNTLTTFKSCSVKIAGQDCGCEVCEGGSGVQLDCTELIDSHVPEFLDPVLNYTVQCVYPGVFEGESSSSAGMGLLAPFVTLNV